uniref:Uncharacterized protein n=1 Tax=Triticum urartu TaxID=4572 RepID=A0A8R7R0G3_TRIUA
MLKPPPPELHCSAVLTDNAAVSTPFCSPSSTTPELPYAPPPEQSAAAATRTGRECPPSSTIGSGEDEVTKDPIAYYSGALLQNKLYRDVIAFFLCHVILFSGTHLS